MRYQIYKGSISDHCCFEATVVDTTKPIVFDGKHFQDSDKNGGQYHYEPLCECFDVFAAEKICAALNAFEEYNEKTAI